MYFRFVILLNYKLFALIQNLVWYKTAKLGY